MTTSQLRAERGEIWLVRFPFTDLSSTKVRPAVVWAIFGEDAVVIGVFSKVLARSLRKTWVLIKEGEQDFAQTGLAKTSVVKAEKFDSSLFRAAAQVRALVASADVPH